MTAVVYSIFLLSGASALIYEVSWVRALILVFGGSHLAVTSVLSVFMGGLALGGYLIGRRADSMERPLRTYGLLEIGIAASAVLFLLLLKIYPVLYVPLARGADEHRLYLALLRVLFAVIAMIVPTTLMGGTLPLLTRFVSDRSVHLGSHLSFLYGINTLGAVAGTLLAGFLLLPLFGLHTTMIIAIAVNMIAGIAAVALQGRATIRFGGDPYPQEVRREVPPSRHVPAEQNGQPLEESGSTLVLVLWGIAISGFCALGYEVLWTRILGIVIGTSVYGFTIMLVSFLSGIALGSQTYGLVQRILRGERDVSPRSVAGFGVVQVVIGVTALGVTYLLRDLPALAIRIQNLFLSAKLSEFDYRQIANFLVSFTIMFLPAFFMGIAFPLAGRIHVKYREAVGQGIGEVVAYNTVGAILGAAASGFVLIYLFGIERSLLLLSALNIGAGLTIVSGARGRRMFPWAVAGLSAAALLVVAVRHDWGRMWDAKYFAIYRNNQREAFNTPERIRDARENTDVLFFHEGINETISVIQPKGGERALLVNGKVVASSTIQDRQCQYTLGHLPMLLHKNPKKVWVLGMGTGMTVGATSIHPEAEEVTLLEIEREVIDGARKFGPWNHEVADNPKLKIVINDGRNYLLTTGNRYDVITADPIHPWTRGSSSLYTTEYYRLASERLAPGGIMCQWVPIYELTIEDLKSIVKTFGENFRYMMLWLTHYDAELIGSNEPIVIDEVDLDRRIRAVPAIAADLKSVEMGSAADFLSYFVMGTNRLRTFARDGVINTDDNLFLEFSAPRSIGLGALMGANIRGLTRYRESILPYLGPVPGEGDRLERKRRWDRSLEAARIYDQAHVLFMWGRHRTEEYERLASVLTSRYPDYSPGRFLDRKYIAARESEPKLLRYLSWPLLEERGGRKDLEISVVMIRIGGQRAVVMFVDNRAREIYGQLYMDGKREELEERIGRFADRVLGELDRTYRGEAAVEAGALPRFSMISERFKGLIASMIREATGRLAEGSEATAINGSRESKPQ